MGTKQAGLPVRRDKSGGGRVKVGKSTVDALLASPLDIRDWDDEELARGRRRAVDGTFKGKDPKVIPKQVHDEWKRRMFSKATAVAVDNAELMMKILVEIATSPMAYDADRIKAAGMLLDRVMGKSPERVELSVETPKWLLALQGGIVPSDGSEEEVLDVTWTETKSA